MTEYSLIVLIGTKAQFIKTAPILRGLDCRGIEYRLVYTGQHSETFGMLEAAFGTRVPDDEMVPGVEASTHRTFFSWAVSFWHAAWQRRSEWKCASYGLVHGDTASTLFGALALRLVGVSVLHVEAGLRSPRLLKPFPEELVRRAVSRLSSVHFAPDDASALNLEKSRGKIVVTRGNTLRDSLAMVLSGWETVPTAGGGAYAVVSIHRTENLTRARRFDFLMNQVLEIAGVVPVRFVLHPTTREKLRSSTWYDRLMASGNVELMERKSYPMFIRMLIDSECLFTDGGSNQEEAAMLGIPTMLFREETERSDGLTDNVCLSYMRQGAAAEFARHHRGKSWRIRPIENLSPSSIIVDAIAASLAQRR